MALPREGARKTSWVKAVCTSPDVCKTPIGAKIVPIPYHIVETFDHCAATTSTVHFTGDEVFTTASFGQHVHGDAPGTAKGVKSGTVEAKTEYLAHSANVRAEGNCVLRHLDDVYMNCKNTTGKIYCSKDTKDYSEEYIAEYQLASAAEKFPVPSNPPPKTVPKIPPKSADIIDIQKWKQERGLIDQARRQSGRLAPRVLGRLGGAAAGILYSESTAPFWMDQIPSGETQTEIWRQAREYQKSGEDIDEITDWVNAQEEKNKERIQEEQKEQTQPAITPNNVRVDREEDDKQCKRTVVISRSKSPLTSKHIEDAQAAGHARILTLDRPGAAARSRQALKGFPTKSGMDRDEYPPKVFLEGGTGASVRHIPYSDNRSAGNQLQKQMNTPVRATEGCIVTITTGP